MPPADDDLDDASQVQERAEAGAARSGRRSRFGLIVTVLLVALVLVAVRGAGLGSGGSSDEGSDGSGGQGRGSDRSSTTTAPDAMSTTGADPTAAPAQQTTSSSVAPPDVAEPRPTVDLAARPPAADPMEVARWWAATFVAYSPAEPAADLVARLDPYTSAQLRQALLQVPPAASYDAPVEIAGVSAQEAPGARAGSRQVTVSVETPGALVVYRLVMVPASTGWQVDEANRL